MATRRRLILEAIVARVQAIQIVDGFETDAGVHVYLGEAPALGPDDEAQAIAVVVGDEEPNWPLHGKANQIRLPISVQAIAKVDLDQPWLAVEALIGDIKRAVELENRTLGGLVDSPLERGPVLTLPKEPGSTTVGAAVNYRALFKESWGAP